MRNAMQRIFSTTAVLGLMAGAAGQAQAAFVLFTDRPSFQAAVGSLTTENFNSIITDTVFTNSTLSFPGLTLRSTGGATADILVDVPPYEFNPGSANIDGTARVNLGGLRPGSSVVSILFNAPVSAVGFDTVNYDIDNDTAQAFVGSTLIGSFPPASNLTGFIGVLDTSGATISSVDIRTSAAGNAFNAFDNVSFATGGAAVPEPSSLVLVAIAGLAGIGAARRRRGA